MSKSKAERENMNDDDLVLLGYTRHIMMCCDARLINVGIFSVNSLYSIVGENREFTDVFRPPRTESFLRCPAPCLAA